jgi:hypothetical protein
MLEWCLNALNWRDPSHGWLAQILGFMLGKAMSLLNLSTGLLILPAALSALRWHGTCILIHQSVP